MPCRVGELSSRHYLSERAEQKSGWGFAGRGLVQVIRVFGPVSLSGVEREWKEKLLPPCFVEGRHLLEN